MGKLTFYIFELGTYAYFLLMLRHAWTATRCLPMFGKGTERAPGDDVHNRGRWLSTLIWGAIFGVGIELLLTKFSTYYYSTEFLVMVPNLLCPDKPVPLCIGVGWGIFLYATTWTSQRLQLSLFVRAVFAGALAVGIDLGLDPSADLFGFWRWPNEEGYAPYFKVPFDNFIGWFLIVSLYSGLVRFAFAKLKDKLGSTYWVPALAAAFSIGTVFVVDEYVLPAIYEPLNGDILPFMVLFGFVLWLVSRESRKRPIPIDLDPSWPVLLVPVVYLGMCWALLLAHGVHREADNAALLLAIPLTLLVSFFAFAWGSLGAFFPREVRS